MDILDTLRQRIADDDDNKRQIALAAGIGYATLYDFAGGSGISGENAAKLAEYYNLELLPKKRKRKPKQ